MSLATGTIGIRRLCAENEHFPDPNTIYRWQHRFPEFREQYARAKEMQLAAIEDEMLEIADDGANDWMEVKHGDSVSWRENGEAARRSTLRLDTRKWLMAKLLPKKYGDKLTHSGDADNPINMGLQIISSVPRPKQGE